MVNAAVLPQWTEEISDARVEDKDVKLETPQGGIPMIGYFQEYGEFEVGSTGFSAWRRGDWKEKPYAQPYRPVFAVPADLKTAKFVLGSASAEIQIPAPGPAPDPAKELAVKVVNVGFTNDIKSQHSVGDIQPKPTTVVDGGGQILLEMKIKVTPAAANNSDGSYFYYGADTFGLVLDKGHYVPCLGQIQWNQFNQKAGHTISKGSDGTLKSEESTIYFAIPPGVTSYKLTYRSAVVAEGKLQTTAGPEPTPPAGTPPTTGAPPAGSEEQKAKDTLKNVMDGLKKKK
jgi:hypothetical protein